MNNNIGHHELFPPYILPFCFLVGLMGLLEKRRFRNFLIYTSDYDENDPKTFKGMNNQGTTSPSKIGLDA